MASILTTEIQRVQKIFDKMPEKRDRELTFKEFIDASDKDPTIVQVGIINCVSENAIDR